MNVVLLVGLILSGLCMIFNKSKVTFGIALIYIWIIFAGAYGHADYFSAEQTYYACLFKSVGVEDPLWLILEKIFYGIGFSFQGFLAITATFFLIILAVVIFKMTKNIGIVLGLYMICPFSLDVVQYNNFCGMVMVLYASLFLMKERRNIIKFILLMLLATGICSYCVVYFLLLLTLMDMKKIFQIMVVAVPIIAFAPNIVFQIAQRFVRIEKLKIYFMKVNNETTVLVLEAFVLIYIMLIVLMGYFAQNGKLVIKQNTRIGKRFDWIIKVNMVMSITLALQIYSLEAARFYRNIFLLNYIAVSYIRYVNIGVGNSKKGVSLNNVTIPVKKQFWTGVFEIAVITATILYAFLYTYYWNKDTVFIPVFQNNLFLGWL